MSAVYRLAFDRYRDSIRSTIIPADEARGRGPENEAIRAAWFLSLPFVV